MDVRQKFLNLCELFEIPQTDIFMKVVDKAIAEGMTERDFLRGILDEHKRREGRADEEKKETPTGRAQARLNQQASSAKEGKEETQEDNPTKETDTSPQKD